MDKGNLLKGLTAEQIKKAKMCKTIEELLALAEEEGIELTEEQLAEVVGGVSQESYEPMTHIFFEDTYTYGISGFTSQK